ncbi:MAG: pyridoxal phosphate-dependent aminotransferase [Desulfuromonadia bacterium]
MPIATKIAVAINRSSWIRKMFEEGARLRAVHGPEKVFDFTIGNPDVEPPPQFREEFRRLANDPVPGMHRYMSNAGYDETRSAVAELLSETHGVPVTKEHVVMTCGAGGGLNVVLKTILNPGEEIIILSPYFVEYRFYIDNHGGVPVEVPTVDGTFQLDLDAIERAITHRTRGIIICSPNNPTGVIYPEDDLARLGELVRRMERIHDRQIFVISDEPYARISYDGKRVPPIFPLVDSSVIVTSHSKDLALPGERIGYLAANPRMRKVDQFMEGAVFSNRVLGFVNAPALMQRLVTPLQRVSVDVGEYQTKRDFLFRELTSLGFSMVKPDGAFYLFPRSPIPDDLEFVRRAQQHLILIVPGSGFGTPGYFRIAYCVDRGMIEKSLPAWRSLARDLGLEGA